jgi:5-deoxy-glucuronate isomerase
MVPDRKLQAVRGGIFKAKHLPAPPEGYPEGFTRISGFRKDDTTLAVSFLKLSAGQNFEFNADNETAFLLASGSVAVDLEGRKTFLTRKDVFAEDPSCIHLPAGSSVNLIASGDTILTVYEAPNTKPFPARIYKPEDTVSVYFDDKAKPIEKPTGTATDRRVRTIFDNSNDDKRLHTHPDATLTVGEVLSLPACWSSWRPHHHQEPKDKIPRGYIEEAYLYFTNAWGLSQMGEGQWQEVRNHDLVLHRGNNHSQASTPDGAVCYSWVIHTPPGHKWVRYLDPVYQPK